MDSCLAVLSGFRVKIRVSSLCWTITTDPKLSMRKIMRRWAQIVKYVFVVVLRSLLKLAIIQYTSSCTTYVCSVKMILLILAVNFWSWFLSWRAEKTRVLDENLHSLVDWNWKAIFLYATDKKLWSKKCPGRREILHMHYNYCAINAQIYPDYRDTFISRLHHSSRLMSANIPPWPNKVTCTCQK